MVSAAKYARAERELKPARAYGKGAQGITPILNINSLFLSRLIPGKPHDTIISTCATLCLLFSYICFTAFFEAAEMEQDEKKPNHLMIAMTSDRGLCGAVHSSVVKAIRARIQELPSGTNYKLICIGDKAKTMFAR